MTKTADMSAAEILRWASSVTSTNIADIAWLLDSGIDDTEDLEYVMRAPFSWRKTAEKLAGLGGADGATSREIAELLEIVGARVLHAEHDNVGDWTEIGRSITEHHRHVGRSSSTKSAGEVIDAMLDAGHGLAYARAIVLAAVETPLPVDAFGFPDGITPAAFTALARAGLRNGDDLRAFEEAGLSLADAAELAVRGIPSSSVRAAVATGLPRERWLDLLPGMNHRWFPQAGPWDGSRDIDPTSGILRAADATWENLHELAISGWADLEPRKVNPDARSAMKHDELGQFTIATALRAARAGISYEVAKRWGEALTLGKRGAAWNDQALPPIAAGLGLNLDRHLDQIARWTAAGMKPSHVSEFRACGARSAEHIDRILDQGLDVKALKSLRESRGKPYGYKGKHRRFPSLDSLLGAVRESQPGA